MVLVFVSAGLAMLIAQGTVQLKNQSDMARASAVIPAGFQDLSTNCQSINDLDSTVVDGSELETNL